MTLKIMASITPKNVQQIHANYNQCYCCWHCVLRIIYKCCSLCCCSTFLILSSVATVSSSSCYACCYCCNGYMSSKHSKFVSSCLNSVYLWQQRQCWHKDVKTSGVLAATHKQRHTHTHTHAHTCSFVSSCWWACKSWVFPKMRKTLQKSKLATTKRASS